MNKYLQWFLASIVLILIILAIIAPPMIRIILFAVLVYGGYIVKLIFFPLFVVIAYADIIYISIGLFFLFVILGYYLLKKYYRITKHSLTVLFLVLVPLAGLSSYFEAIAYIQKVAKEKYHTTPIWMKINLSKWTSFDFQFTGHSTYGLPHAEIKINNKKYHWSFDERDFVKNRH